MLRWWLAACALTGCSTVLGLGDPKPATDAMDASCTIGDYDLCAHQEPNGALDFTADTTINTDRDCDLVLYQPGAISACVLYATTIHVASGTTVTAVGTRPLVLAAHSSVTVDGTIDVSSHTIDQFNARAGAGANDPACSFKQAAVYASNGAGGGAGGTFGGKGGDGGNGDAGLPGLASDVGPPPMFPRGGCGGGNAFSAGGQASDSGGGLWIVGGDSVSASASARLLANGAGGNAGGQAGLGGPASGGGSGGFVYLGAPSISLAGLVTANGGGGGGGQGNSPGTAGADGTASTTQATGGAAGGGGGGAGGKGSAGTILAGSSGSSSALVQNACGGGGGGGAGIIRLAGGSVSTAGATITPPAQ